MDADAETGVDVMLLAKPFHGHQYQVEVVYCRALHCPVHSAGDKLGKQQRLSQLTATESKLSCCVMSEDVRMTPF